jgi:hypothetical protein
MPATPRLGDGWRMGYQPGVVDVRASVATIEPTVTTRSGSYRDVVGLDVSSPLDPSTSSRASYARGVGLIEEVSTAGPVSLVELESPPG